MPVASRGAGLERVTVNSATHGRIVSFIWGIADDVLRDLYVRGKYRDVILPFTVLRRLDSVLEPTKQAVLEMKQTLDAAGIENQDPPLRQAAGQDFYNTSAFTLRDLRSANSQARLRSDFEAYLDGYSPNVQEILDNFEVRNQIPKLTKADALGSLIEKFLDPSLDLSPTGLDNHGMGSVFEELVRRFNEENNEEAGEHWTPRDAVRLMARLIFDPIADHIPSGTYRLYDGAMGTGGMLTVAEETLKELATARGKQISTHLYGQEINAETYAIAKADLILKGEGAAADNIVGGPEWSTLSNDAFPGQEFDFMLLATGGADGTVRLWDRDSHHSVGTLQARGGVSNVMFSPDGHTLIASMVDDSGESGTQSGAEVRRWTGLWDQEQGCAIAARYVDRAQLDPYLPTGWRTACTYTG